MKTSTLAIAFSSASKQFFTRKLSFVGIGDTLTHRTYSVGRLICIQMDLMTSVDVYGLSFSHVSSLLVIVNVTLLLERSNGCRGLMEFAAGRCKNVWKI